VGCEKSASYDTPAQTRQGNPDMEILARVFVMAAVGIV
jgi:hypothetical protein